MVTHEDLYKTLLDEFLDSVDIFNFSIFVIKPQVSCHAKSVFIKEDRLGFIKVTHHGLLGLCADLPMLEGFANCSGVWIDNLYRVIDS